MRRRTGRTWRLFEVMDTVKGLWEWIPGWFKGMVAGIIIPGGPLAYLAIVQKWFVETWPVFAVVIGSGIVVGVVTGLILRGRPPKEPGENPFPVSEGTDGEPVRLGESGPIELEIRSANLTPVPGTSMVGVIVEVTFRPKGHVQLAECMLMAVDHPIRPVDASPLPGIPTLTLPKVFEGTPETHWLFYHVPAIRWRRMQGPNDYSARLRVLAGGEEYDSCEFTVPYPAVNLRMKQIELLNSSPTDFECKPSLLVDADYGPEHGTALYITVKLTGTAEAARGRLVSILPTGDKPDISRIPALNYPSGLLQWSARYGGGELASFASECELDVLAFENEDDVATVVYLNNSFRKNKLLLDAADAWEVKVEVFTEDGQSCFCNFRITRGKGRVFALSSPRGTLYEPLLEEI